MKRQKNSLELNKTLLLTAFKDEEDKLKFQLMKQKNSERFLKS